MSRITAIQYSKVFSLGNFENEKIGVTAEVLEGENPNDVLEKCKIAVEMNSSSHCDEMRRLEDIVTSPEQHRYSDVEKAKRKLAKFQDAKAEAVTEMSEEIKKLTHHKDTTVGLWATDIDPEKLHERFIECNPGCPLVISDTDLKVFKWIKENLFHQISY